jgi:hypothetical protein
VLQLVGAELQLRGREEVRQPLQGGSGNVLVFNGEELVRKLLIIFVGDRSQLRVYRFGFVRLLEKISDSKCG